MILIPDDIRARLLANGALDQETDHIPVVKLFDPCGAAIWLITEIMDDGDTLFYAILALALLNSAMSVSRRSSASETRWGSVLSAIYISPKAGLG